MDAEDNITALLTELASASTAEAPRKTSTGTPSEAQDQLGPVEFNEALYLETYPDVASLIDAKKFSSGFEHYISQGKSEGRLLTKDYQQALGYHSRALGSAVKLPFSVDAALVSESGMAFLVGWVDDRQRALKSVSVISGIEGANTRGFGRCRRTDVEGALAAPIGHSFGFWTVLQLMPGQYLKGPWTVRLLFEDGTFATVDVQGHMVTEIDLRTTILGHFAAAEYYGNRDIESFDALESGVGRELILLNRSISASICRTAHVEHFGPRKAFKASLIVCLYGKHEFLFLQNALFSRTKNYADYEYIYVSNSPELSEILHKEARIAERIYGISLTLITLSGNAGFSAANNVAARFASSDRIIIVNPDVFPIDADWADKHEEIISTLPFEQTALFGAPLYYDDGSLMHGGMYFEVDRGLSIKPKSIYSRGMIRVEHYGKGAPASSSRYSHARPVPAITGAFMSADRAWFEQLGGFNEEHLFGHYEDADLCLKSLARGIPVWMHDIRFWHLEGKGSVRRHEHEGGSLVNRWLFTRNWGSLIEAELSGRTPSHSLMNPDAAETPQTATIALARRTAAPSAQRKGPVVRSRSSARN